MPGFDPKVNFYRGMIKREPGTIIVFGSNTGGQHGGGSARAAYDDFGAVWGEGTGLHGQSYAIPTIHFPDGQRSVSLDEITARYMELYEKIRNTPELQKWKFKIAITGTDDKPLLSGYSGLELMQAIEHAGEPPANVYISDKWVDIFEYERQPSPAAKAILDRNKFTPPPAADAQAKAPVQKHPLPPNCDLPPQDPLKGIQQNARPRVAPADAGSGQKLGQDNNIKRSPTPPPAPKPSFTPPPNNVLTAPPLPARPIGRRAVPPIPMESGNQRPSTPPFDNRLKTSPKPLRADNTLREFDPRIDFYTGNIQPGPNTVFVFGTDKRGLHEGVAGSTAVEQFGAIPGVNGLAGNSYAIPTVENRPGYKQGTRSFDKIKRDVKEMVEQAKLDPTATFCVAYRNVDEVSGCALTGRQLAAAFTALENLPSNLKFSREWIEAGLLDKFIPAQKAENMQEVKSLPEAMAGQSTVAPNRPSDAPEIPVRRVPEKQPAVNRGLNKKLFGI